jgi:hypothetical protein
MANNEWLEYTVDVPAAGEYTIEVRVASNTTGGNFHIEFGGADKTGNINVPVTGGWQSWTSVSATATLSAGTQVMRFANADSSDEYNINYFDISVDSIRGDLDGDGSVDIVDLRIMAGEWQSAGVSADIEPAGGDGIVNFRDFAALAVNWLQSI